MTFVSVEPAVAVKPAKVPASCAPATSTSGRRHGNEPAASGLPRRPRLLLAIVAAACAVVVGLVGS